MPNNPFITSSAPLSCDQRGEGPLAPRRYTIHPTSPVAIFATTTAAPITSAGRFSPLGPLGISGSL